MEHEAGDVQPVRTPGQGGFDRSVDIEGLGARPRRPAQRIRRRGLSKLDQPADPGGRPRQHRDPVDQIALPARLGLVQLPPADSRPLQRRAAGHRSGRPGGQDSGVRSRRAAGPRCPRCPGRNPGRHPRRGRRAGERSRQHAQPSAGGRATPSTVSSSASRTNWPAPPPSGSPIRMTSPSTRCSSTAASASARPI